MVQWLKQMAHYQEIMGSNPGTLYWMDVSKNASYFIPEKLKTKVAKWGAQKNFKVFFDYFYLFNCTHFFLATEC